MSAPNQPPPRTGVPPDGAPYKLITCILPKGIALGVVEELKSEYEIVTANINNARGTGKITPLAYRGVGEQTEKEILQVVVESAGADEVFRFISAAARVDRPHGGLMYMGAVTRATRYQLPPVPEES